MISADGDTNRPFNTGIIPLKCHRLARVFRSSPAGLSRLFDDFRTASGRALMSGMGTKSRDRLYGTSIRIAAERRPKPLPFPTVGRWPRVQLRCRLPSAHVPAQLSCGAAA